MTRAARFAIVLVGTLVALGLAAQRAGQALPESWQHWQYSRAIDLPAAGDSEFTSVEVPPEVYRHARSSLADIRVIDGEGNEAPYLFHSVAGRHTTEWIEASVIDSGTVPGQYTQAVVDTGTAGTLHNSVLIRTSSRNFFARVQVAASDNRKTWRILEQGLPIYRFQTDSLEGNQTVRYADTRSRWLRFRLAATETEIPITGARLSRTTIEKTERNAYGGTIEPVADPPARQSAWQIEFDGANLPLSEIRFETAASAFHRPVRIQYSRDGENWRNAGSGAIYRFPASGPRGGHESLRVEFGESQGTAWRVYVVNRDDPPIDDLKFTLYGVPRHVVFQPAAAKSYRLLYGNRVATAPRYELARLVADANLGDAARARVAAEEENPSHVDPDPPPWSEQNRFILWFGMLVAVAALGWMAVGALRQPPPKQG